MRNKKFWGISFQVLSLCCLVWLYAAFHFVWSINPHQLDVFERVVLYGFTMPLPGIAFAFCSLFLGNLKMKICGTLLCFLHGAIICVALLPNIFR
jgi:hypothetical protein